MTSPFLPKEPLEAEDADRMEEALLSIELRPAERKRRLERARSWLEMVRAPKATPRT